MNINSLNKAREVANIAFDEHCKQWELLEKISEPTLDNLSAWLSAHEKFYEAQSKFENIIRSQQDKL